MKRENGAGTIQKIGKKFYPLVSTGNILENGLIERKSLGGFPTKSKAEKAIAQYNKTGKASINRNSKLTDYLNLWLSLKEFASESTKNNYRIQINHINRCLGSTKLCKIKKMNLMKMFKELASREKLSKASIDSIKRILKSALNDAVKSRYIDFNEMRHIKQSGVEKKRLIMPDNNKFKTMIQIFIEDKKYKFPLLFGLLLGLRRGEALGVKWEDIDFAHNVIRISRQVVFENGCIVVKKPKSTTSTRVVAMFPLLTSELNKISLEKRKGFVAGKAAKQNPNYLSTYFRTNLSPKLGLGGNFTFHSLRHINASMFLSVGYPMSLVSSHHGHGDIKTTVNLYGHETPMQLEQEAETANRIFPKSLVQRDF